jgi:hypothetical protein
LWNVRRQEEVDEPFSEDAAPYGFNEQDFEILEG